MALRNAWKGIKKKKGIWREGSVVKLETFSLERDAIEA